MAGIFGGNNRVYWGINTPFRSASHSEYPMGKSLEEKRAWLKEGKDQRAAFVKWYKENGYKVEGYSSRAAVSVALDSFKVKPPVNVEIYDYMCL